jgi:hypothetical protein
LPNKIVSVRGELERGVIGRPLHLKISGDIVLRVAIAVRADDPDFFAAQLFAQRLQHANLIGNAVDPRSPLRVRLHHRITPEVPDDPIERDILIGWIGAHATLDVLLQER